MKKVSKRSTLFACLLLVLMGWGCKEPVDPPVPPAIVPCFSIVPDTFRDPREPVQFLNCSQKATSYIWDFGDGHYSTEAEPMHTYATVGYFDVRLTAIDKDYEQDTVMRIRVDYPRFKKIRIVQLPVLNPDNGMPYDSDGNGLDLYFRAYYDYYPGLLAYGSPLVQNVSLPYEFVVDSEVSIHRDGWSYWLFSSAPNADTICWTSREFVDLMDSPVEVVDVCDSVIFEIVMGD